jgi:signal transduction histidine kinase
LVKQRTEKLMEKNKQLEEYAFFNAHKLRRPVSSIMGICNLLRGESNPQEQYKLLDYLNRSVKELDVIVRQIQEIVDEE